MEPLFEVRNLSVGYDTPLLRDISFSARPGEVIGILGRNGCGKTTLLRGLSGSIRRFGGSVLAAGKDCAAMSPRQQAAWISLLPQQTQVLEGISPRQLIEMGRYPHGSIFGGWDRTGEALLQENARRLGITDLLDGDCAKLSQGQRQLVLLCRLLVQDTPVMLLDEPNAALDYDNTYTLFHILREVAEQQKKTALLVLHDPELALAQCHRLLVMKDGKLIGGVATAKANAREAENLLGQIYPNILVREDPVCGHLRCYYQARRDSLC